MKTLTRNQSVAAALLAAVTFTLPTAAQAQTYGSSQHRAYTECKKDDKDNQIIGGVIGAVAGGILGSQVAANGARTEGSVLGAAIGAAAGAGIGDDRNNCSSEVGYARTGTTYSNYPSRTQTYGSSYPTTYRNYPTNGYRNTHYHRSHPVTRTPGRAYGNPHVRRSYQSVAQIEWEIDRLRDERDRLKDQRRYRYDRYLDQRIHEIGEQIGWLKDEKKRVKKRNEYVRPIYY